MHVGGLWSKIIGPKPQNYILRKIFSHKPLNFSEPTGFSREQFREVPSYLDGDATLGVRPHSHHRRKYEIKKKDSDYPKQNRSVYVFFFAE